MSSVALGCMCNVHTVMPLLGLPGPYFGCVFMCTFEAWGVMRPPQSEYATQHRYSGLAVQVGTVLEDVNAEVATGLYMDSTGRAQVLPLHACMARTYLICTPGYKQMSHMAIRPSTLGPAHKPPPGLQRPVPPPHTRTADPLS